MSAYWTKDEHAMEYDEWVNELLLNAPESYDDDAAAEEIVVRYVRDLEQALEDTRKVLMFADGHSYAQTAYRLTWLYASDCEWAQRALAGAKCPVRYDAGEEPFCHPLVDATRYWDRGPEECSCGGKRWVEDENWSPDYLGPGVQPVRNFYNGLIPCGFCNPDGEVPDA